MTIHSCANGFIHHNNFRDNTDVDLVVGGGVGCRVENNTIEHGQSYAFAGLHVGWFAGYDGNHNGSTFTNNNVTSTLVDKLGVGVVVGQHLWNPTLSTSNAVVRSNFSQGAVVNLAVDGTVGGEVQANSWSNARGLRGKDREWNPKDYTAGRDEPSGVDHAPGTLLQSGWSIGSTTRAGVRGMGGGEAAGGAGPASPLKPGDQRMRIVKLIALCSSITALACDKASPVGPTPSTEPRLVIQGPESTKVGHSVALSAVMLRSPTSFQPVAATWTSTDERPPCRRLRSRRGG